MWAGGPEEPLPDSRPEGSDECEIGPRGRLQDV